MPGGRAYDYSAPFFGGFTCLPPTQNTTRADRAGFASSRQDSLNRSRAEYASSSRQSSIVRDSLVSQRSLSRGDSLAGSRPPLTRMESLGRSGLSSTTTTTSTTTYKSPYSSSRY